MDSKRILTKACLTIFAIVTAATSCDAQSPFGFAKELTEEQVKMTAELHEQGVTLMSQGQFKEATKKLREALEVDASHAPSHRQLGRCWTELGFSDLALRSLSTAISVDPRHAGGYAQRGNVYLQLGRFREAHGDFRSAYQLEPLNADYSYSYGLALMNQAEKTEVTLARKEILQQAKAAFDRSIRLDPQQAIPHYKRSLCNVELSDSESARSDLEQALRLDMDRELIHAIAKLNVDLLMENGRLRGQISAMKGKLAPKDSKNQGENQTDETIDEIRLLTEIRDLLRNR